jgi:3-deoxy-7-phosphoheptulonate synthase
MSTETSRTESDPAEPDPERGAGLEAARRTIDELDGELVRLLARRMAVARGVRALKSGDVRDAAREDALLDRWARRADEAGLSRFLAGRVLHEILLHSRRLQGAHSEEADPAGAPRVGFQGERYAYSDLAAEKLFATRDARGSERVGFPTFQEAIDAVREGRVDYALLPVENSVVGNITAVSSLLVDSGLAIVDEETWAVDHVLAGVAGSSLARVRCVRSHPVALAQCHAFLSRVSAELEPCADTAGAAAELAVSGEPDVGVICSAEAAAHHGLTVLKRGIADSARNVTRFLLLARQAEPVPRGVPAKTSLFLTLDHEQGALARCLGAFADEGLNLTRIESRPIPDEAAPAGRAWQYSFFLDVEGHTDDPALARALEVARRSCNLLRVLGTYPHRAAEQGPVPSARVDVVPPEAEAEPMPGSCPAEPSAAGSLQAPPEPRSGTRALEASGVEIGGSRFVLIAGPCAVESREQILAAADMVQRRGARLLRGGAFKPRSSPYSFQGLGHEGLALLREAGDATALPIVTELLRIEDLPAVARSADVIQVGARNMQNFALLRELGKVDRPVLLKRGMSATLKELLQAAEYILSGGNQRVILCERGIRTFETATRSTLDVSAVPVLKERTHLPVIVDPSHAAGVRSLVVPLALAAAAAGADGLIVECHPRPEEALCDKEQALRPEDLDELVERLRPIVTGQGRSL